MELLKRCVSVLCVLSMLGGGFTQILKPISAEAANPYLPLWEHVPDGEPHVFEDPDNPGKYRIYIYGSHDILKNAYCGNNQVVWSAPVEKPTEWRYDGISFQYDMDGTGNYDLLYAPDVCETTVDGEKVYYLYPNNMTGSKVVAKSSRPDGPFEVCATGCGLGGDPAVFVDDDGQVYGYWGWKTSFLGKIDRNDMATVYDIVNSPLGGWDESETDDNIFRFYEASSMRKILGKYVYIYSRKTCDGEFGLPVDNSTLAYAYSDSPMGPFEYGGTIIDARARNTDENGNVFAAYPGGNTHGSVENINGEWYVFYHRQTNRTESCRQGMVEKVNVYLDENDKLVIEEAEVTSQGFETEGLNPYEVHSAGITCYLNGNDDKPYIRAEYDETADMNSVVNIKNGSVIGFKYFNFDDLKEDTKLEIGLTPMGVDAEVTVMVDAPWESTGGSIIGTFDINASDRRMKNIYITDVASVADLNGKHAVYFLFNSQSSKKICEFHDFVFDTGEQKLVGGSEEMYFGRADRSKWTVSANVDPENSASNMIDGDKNSRWTSGDVMNGSENVILDMGGEWTFNEICLKSDGDYARSYRILVSNDNKTYTEIAAGKGSDADNPYQTIKFDTQRARYIKIEQNGKVDTYTYWSIYDLNVFYNNPKYISKAAWSASCENVGDVWWGTENVIDDVVDDLNWTTYTEQKGGETFIIDMGKTETLNRLILYCNNDYPRGYKLSVSENGTDYAQIAHGDGYADDDGKMTIDFERVDTRYVKIEQTGTASGIWLSYYEIFAMNVEDEETETPVETDFPSSVRAWTSSDNGDGTFDNPVIFADTPDPDVIRVGDVYYMTSTTMHMSPGVPVMKSYDLVNWEIVNYVYDNLEQDDERSLKNGKSDYANGSWASSLRYDEELRRFFISFTCESTNSTYIYSTADIENGPWHRSKFNNKKYYDGSMYYEWADGKYNRYYLYAETVQRTKEDGITYEEKRVHIADLDVDPVTFDVSMGENDVVLMESGNLQNPPEGLSAEGYHVYHIGEYYYIIMIQGHGWMRQEICWRKAELTPGDWEGKLVFAGDMKDENGNTYMQSTGIAQGGLVDTPNGDWYSLLFLDYGAVGRIPVLLKADWEDGWPVIGNNGEWADKTMDKPSEGPGMRTIVTSDEFDNGTARRISDENQGSNAGIGTEQIRAMLAADANAENIIINGDFSKGVENWEVNGNPTLNVHNGVLKVEKRDGTWSGPAQNITDKLEAGKGYRFSAKIKYDDSNGGNISKSFGITLLYDGQFSNLAYSTVDNHTEWTTVSGEFVATEAMENAQNCMFFIETAWTEEQSDADKTDFMVDDIELKPDSTITALAENEYDYNGSNLKLEWQWNHNPNNNLWSLTERPGWLRLKSGALNSNIRTARNTLTQRTFGPVSAAETLVDVSDINNGDFAGLTVYQNQYGFVGVTMENGQKYIVMQRARHKDDKTGTIVEKVSFDGDMIYLRGECVFKGETDKIDQANFYYSTDGKKWSRIGDTLYMAYDWPDFVGYRFGLFYYSTENKGGYVDFDYFHVDDILSKVDESPSEPTDEPTATAKPVVAVEGNLINNFSFEDGCSDEGTPYWWATEYGDENVKTAVVSCSDKEVYSGNYSAKISKRSSSDDSIFQYQELKSGKTYKVKAAVKYCSEDNTPRNSVFNIKVYLDYWIDTTMASAIVNADEWTLIEGTYTVPDDHTGYVVTFDSTDLMDFYVDDVSIVEVSDKTKKNWTLEVEKNTDDKISVTVSKNKSDAAEAVLYVVYYSDDGRMISVQSENINSVSGSVNKEFAINDDTRRTGIYLWNSQIQEPLTDGCIYES